MHRACGSLRLLLGPSSRNFTMSNVVNSGESDLLLVDPLNPKAGPAWRTATEIPLVNATVLCDCGSAAVTQTYDGTHAWL